MQLKTLGSLALKGSSFKRTKPLLLLSYLALEGVKPRQHVAELFWYGIERPLSSLSVALSQLRKGVPDSFASDDLKVWTDLDCDAKVFLNLLDEGEFEKALAHYRGAFLEGLPLKGYSVELEEWVYTMREFLAERAREAMLVLAERSAARADFVGAAKQAERAFHLSGVPTANPEILERLYRLFQAGASIWTTEVRREAEGFGLSFTLSQEDAQAFFAGKKSHARSLPIPRTALVGRDPERLELENLLTQEECRLLTLVGPGGMGKTRLALQLALDFEATDIFTDGVYFVELDAVSTPSLIGASLADALGMTLRGASEPLEQVAQHIGSKELLLILDNFEHLIEATVDVIELLQVCPRMKLLVSSRERLNVVEEWLFIVEGLTYPKVVPENLEALRAFDAIQLFSQRAKQIDVHLNLDEEDLKDVLRICQLVDGSPLGLELAATWVKVIPLADIPKEIEQNLDFLSSPLLNPPNRHKSLKTVFEYSWQLLTQDEQRLLSNLAVFNGGFRREAAVEVTGASLLSLRQLVNKSFLRLSPTGRYNRHFLIYQYTHEKLAESPIKHEVEANHGNYFGSFLATSVDSLMGEMSKKWLLMIDEDLENIRIAWRWCVNNEQLELLKAASIALHIYFDVRARYHEGLTLLDSGIRGLNPTKPSHKVTLGYLHSAQALFYERVGNYDASKRAAEQSLALIAHDPNDEGMTMTLRFLGNVAWRIGDYQTAKHCFEKAQALLEDKPANWETIQLFKGLANVRQAFGDYAMAEHYFKEGLTLARNLGNHTATVNMLNNLGSLYLIVKDFEKAYLLLTEGLELAKDIGAFQISAHLLANLSLIAYERKSYEQALVLSQEALTLSRTSSDKRLEAGILADMGSIAVAQTEYKKAEQYFQQGFRIARETQNERLALYLLVRFAELQLEQENVSLALRLLRLALNQPSLEQQDKDFAEHLLSSLGEKFPREKLDEELSQNKHLSLWKTISSFGASDTAMDAQARQ